MDVEVYLVVFLERRWIWRMGRGRKKKDGGGVLTMPFLGWGKLLWWFWSGFGGIWWRFLDVHAWLRKVGREGG